MIWILMLCCRQRINRHGKLRIGIALPSSLFEELTSGTSNVALNKSEIKSARLER